MSWNDLTDRQKSLDRAIEQSCIKLDHSASCLRRVMSAIGAVASETDFVRQRIELRIRTAALLDKTDAFIADTENMLQQFEKDDEEWRKKGRALGFDF